jgi:uncharacterized protein
MMDEWTRLAAAAVKIPLEDVPEAQRIEGSPRTGAVRLGSFGGATVGVWEMTPGVMSDVEVDEMLVVLTGAATVELDDGRRISLEPGDVAQLRAGQKTIWTVTRTLRKVFFALRA